MITFGTFDTVVRLIYLAAAVCFVLGSASDELAGDRAARQPAFRGRHDRRDRGDLRAADHALRHDHATGWIVLLAGMLVGSVAGLYSARTVKMTAMPQLVSLFNAVGGGAAAIVAIDDFVRARDRARVAERGRNGGGGDGPGRPHRRRDLHRLAHRRRQAARLGERRADHVSRITGGQRVAGRHHGRRGHLADDREQETSRSWSFSCWPPRIRRDHGAADRRRGHASGHLAAERLHGHGRRDGRFRHQQPGADHCGRPGRRIRKDPHQADGRRDEPLDPQHHHRRLRYR